MEKGKIKNKKSLQTLPSIIKRKSLSSPRIPSGICNPLGLLSTSFKTCESCNPHNGKTKWWVIHLHYKTDMLIFVKIKLALAELKSMIEPDLKGMPYTYSPKPIPSTSSLVPTPQFYVNKKQKFRSSKNMQKLEHYFNNFSRMLLQGMFSENTIKSISRSALCKIRLTHLESSN